MPLYDVERLITLIEERPNLWDTRLESYHDRVQKDRSWEEIAKELDGAEFAKADAKKRHIISDQQNKNRWYSCRDQFKRELNLRHKSGDGSLAKKPYLYTENLQFLRPIMETRPTVDNLSNAPEDDQAPSGPASQETPSAPPSTDETPPLETVMEDVPENRTVPQQISTQPRSSGRRRGPPPHDSGLDTRAIVEARVMDYLNQNRGESADETMVIKVGALT
ncbi:uncharacterized protein LOC120993843 [Bufo bufo]|uniref:uncharacterized protein LOC120993843 n=1 Tax=Bufo bufo TaxID=8384 RepID=UPI001ABDD761|nr:uncharacterized protein LOC120993843 [Bufo bufo]